jgi:hypothetical protein
MREQIFKQVICLFLKFVEMSFLRFYNNGIYRSPYFQPIPNLSQRISVKILPFLQIPPSREVVLQIRRSPALSSWCVGTHEHAVAEARGICLPFWIELCLVH